MSITPKATLFLLFTWLLSGCQFDSDLDPQNQTLYVPLEKQTEEIGQLPLAPHVLTLKARPTAAMLQENHNLSMRFRILDKRIMRIHTLDVPVGYKASGPWGGIIELMAFVPDLLIHEGTSLHGPEGHVNPAVWIVLKNEKDAIIYEGWIFQRDVAQTAWDDQRFDLTFMGPLSDQIEQAPLNTETINQELPDQIQPDEQVPTEQVPTEQIPIEQIPTEQIPTEQIPTEKKPTGKKPTEKPQPEIPSQPEQELQELLEQELINQKRL
ncbi:MAG: hypothetical protein H7832_02155 [Magnetococcus sp. DMHC-6]